VLRYAALRTLQSGRSTVLVVAGIQPELDLRHALTSANLTWMKSADALGRTSFRQSSTGRVCRLVRPRAAHGRCSRCECDEAMTISLASAKQVQQGQFLSSASLRFI
jgi:hypothetical protein